MAKGIGADSVLVSAAYRMGMANVPKDTTEIFKRQYQAIADMHTAKTKVIERGLDEFGEIVEHVTKETVDYKKWAAKEDEKDEFEKDKALGDYEDRDDEYFDEGSPLKKKTTSTTSTLSKSGKKIEGMSKDFTANTANDFGKYYEGGSPPPQDLIDHNKDKFQAYKDRIEELDNDKNPYTRRKRKAEKQQIYRQIALLKEETNRRMGNYRAAVVGLRDDEVNLDQSYRIVGEDGVDRYDVEKGTLLAQTINPNHNLRQLGIIPDQVDGQNGFYYTEGRLGAQNIYSNGGTVGGASLDKSKMKWITEKELFGSLKYKDKETNATLNGILGESVDLWKKDETVLGKKLLTVKDYGEIESEVKARYVETLNNTNEGKRDPRGSLIDLQNRDIQVGGEKRNYSVDMEKNMVIDAAVINTAGIGSDVITMADVNGDGKVNSLDSDPKTLKKFKVELEKHKAAANQIRQTLLYPKTPTEVKVAIEHFAEYWNQLTKQQFDKQRKKLKDAGILKGDKQKIKW